MGWLAIVLIPEQAALLTSAYIHSMMWLLQRPSGDTDVTRWEALLTAWFAFLIPPFLHLTLYHKVSITYRVEPFVYQITGWECCAGVGPLNIYQSLRGATACQLK